MNRANLISVKPYQSPSQGGRVVANFDNGQSIIVSEANLFDQAVATNYVARHLRVTIDNAPNDVRQWEDFVLSKWEPTTAPPLATPAQERLCTRNAVATADRASRKIALRAATADPQTLSCDAILATAGRVLVFAPDRGYIEEILIASGAEFPEQIPLLNSHQRGDVNHVLGSVRNIRVDGDQLLGRLFFAAGDEDAEATCRRALSSRRSRNFDAANQEFVP
jgi:hypothetical protein